MRLIQGILCRKSNSRLRSRTRSRKRSTARIELTSSRQELKMYERLLLKAVVFAHIPSLTAGMVRRDVMAHKAIH